LTSNPPSTTSSSDASFGFTSEAGATFACQLDSGGFSACTSPKNYSSLAEGSHTFQVRATDTAGNTGTTTSYSWTVAPPGTLFLHNLSTTPTGDTTAQKNMPMNASASPASTLFRYSSNLYTTQPGRYLEQLATNHTQTDTKYMANWVYQPSTSTATTISGNAELKLWVTAKDFLCDKTPSFNVYLREKTSATTDTGTLIGSATATSPVSGTCSFRLVTVTIPVNETIEAGNWLELKVTVNTSTGESVLFAYDTTTYASKLTLPL
jgi:hypothetical protein